MIRIAILFLCFSISSLSPCAAASPDPAAVAKETERLLQEELGGELSAIPAASDPILLRRMSLDLTGRLPDPSEVVRYLLDTDPSKADKLAERLIHSQQFAENWARYWRDAILFRRTEPRAVQFAGSLESYLTKAFQQNRPWNEIVTDLITASGDGKEDGRTVLIIAQAGQPEDLAGEFSRLFCGIQIQCAQCHDHPTDRWKREEFHQFAAFFPRVAARPNMSDNGRSMLVSVNDRPFMPRNDSGNRFVGTPEHYMSDLENPQEKGTLTKPKFFVTGQGVPFGTPDSIRRGRAALWLTSEKNPWFAKALVNRMWSEFVGRGFYPSVDDLGPDRDCTAPNTLEFLAQSFVASGYDYRWLAQTITMTKAYRSQSLSRGDSTPRAGIVQSVAQPLRSDQLLDALADVLEFDPAEIAATNRRGPGGGVLFLRIGFAEEFGFDPSTNRDEVVGGMSEVLSLMNGPTAKMAVSSYRQPLARLLKQHPANDALIDALYLQALCRLPDPDEKKVALLYLDNSMDGRPMACEDLFWALINSAEFRTRR